MERNKYLSVAIIGTGNIAGGFDENSKDKEAVFTHAKAYLKSEKFYLKTVLDIDIQKAKQFSQFWKAECFSSDEDQLIESFHDVVSICTPDQFHFSTLKKLILNKSCKTIFVEKPIALNLDDIEEIDLLAKKYDINVVVNFQRHFDTVYQGFKEKNVLSVNAYYIKGLKHIGVTMLDTLLMMFGYPIEILTYNKIENRLINDDTYEFILFYDTFNIVVQTIDQKEKYNYHIFDINVFTEGGKVSITDNSNILLSNMKTDYTYSGVSVISSDVYKKVNTNYNKTMLESANYIYGITTNEYEHSINRVSDSYNVHLLVEEIIRSFNENKKISLRNLNWKK